MAVRLFGHARFVDLGEDGTAVTSRQNTSSVAVGITADNNSVSIIGEVFFTSLLHLNERNEKL